MELRMVGALVCMALACASGRWPTESALAPGADFAAYESFGWLPAAGDPSGAPLSIADANLRDAIRAQLVAKGYREVEASPDLRIGFEAASRTKEKTSPPVRIGVGMGSWGGHVGTSVDASLPVGSERVTTLAETRITIRAVDPQADREVWVGSTTGEVQPDFDASALEQAVAAVLADFPARHR